MAKPRAKTGDKRLRNQPLLIDRLSNDVHNEILRLRATGNTWPQIEELSREFVPWDELPPLLVEKFPGRKLPHSNLHRWYDLRVDQVQKEILAESEHAREIASVFAKAAMSGANEAVINAARDLIFKMLHQGDIKSQSQVTKALISLADVMQRARANDIRQSKVDLEKERIEIVRTKLLGLKNDVQKKKLSSDELKQKLDEIYGLAS
jgi:hypothetical protein